MAYSNEGHEVVDTGGEYLTFSLGKEDYGLDILKVREIRGYDSVTPLANAPDYLKGIINLRGIIIPIVDLRIKFLLPEVKYSEFTVMVILNLHDRMVGIVVDGVSDVVRLKNSQIKPPPELGDAFDTEYIIGIGDRDSRMIIIIDVERLLKQQLDSLAA